MKVTNSNKIRFAVLHTSYWCTYGAFNSFVLAYFLELGFNSSQTGLAAGTFTIGAFAGQFFWSRMCDHFKTDKWLYLTGTGLVYLMIIVNYFTVKKGVSPIAVYGMLGFVQGPLAAILNAWNMKAFRREPDQFGPVRSVGSLGYALFVLGYGNIIQRFGYEVMLVFSGIFTIVTLTAGFFTAEEPKNAEIKQEPKVNVLEIFRSRGFAILTLAVLLLGVVSAPMQQLMAVLVKEVGGTLKLQGLAMFICNLFQVPGMLLAPRLSFLSVNQRLMAAAAAYGAGVLICGLFLNSAGIVLAAALNGTAYGILLPALCEGVMKSVPGRLYTTAQGISEMAFSAVGAAVSNLVSGMIIYQYGLRNLMYLYGAVAALAFMILLSATGRKRKGGMNR